jgi:hypothetical protein
VRAGRENLRDLIECELEFLVGREVVRAEADACIGTEVAQNLPLRQLLVHRLEVGDVQGHGASALRRLAR